MRCCNTPPRWSTAWAGRELRGCQCAAAALLGRDTGSQILATVWLLTTVAAVGPLAAGARLAVTRRQTAASIFYLWG